MSKTLSELWNGNLAPAQDLGKNNEDIQHLRELMASNGEALEKDLNEAQKKRWENYSLCAEEYVSLMVEEVFCSGACLGAKIAAETLFGAESIA